MPDKRDGGSHKIDLIVIAPLIILAVLVALFSVAAAWKVAFHTSGVLWLLAKPGNFLVRGLVGALALALFASPVVAYKLYEHAAIIAHVPAPLKIAEIDYRLEQNWAADGSGTGWAGLVVYRLSPPSIQWAREQGIALVSALPGGSAGWRATPIEYDDQYGNWYRYDNLGVTPGVSDYVRQYDFDTSVDKSIEADVNRAIQNAGAFYSYVDPESTTIVDPMEGKVYYFYTPR